MLQRLLLLALGIAALLWWLRRLVGAAPPRTPSGKASRGGAPPSSAERMVRDRVCNTFLPESKALVLQDGEQLHFFCSDRCRQRFLAGRED